MFAPESQQLTRFFLDYSVAILFASLKQTETLEQKLTRSGYEECPSSSTLCP